MTRPAVVLASLSAAMDGGFPRAGAAIMNGLVDSIGVVAPAARDFVLDLVAQPQAARSGGGAQAPSRAGSGSAWGGSPVQRAAARSAAQPSLF
ncbi:MAG: hypothetical protein ACLGHT_10815 [Acidimicrobiia bacterium]